MQRYRPRRRVVHAVRWWRHGDHPCVYRTDDGSDMAVRRGTPPVAVGRGQWLVWLDGRTDGPPDAVMLPKEFARQFEIDEESGAGS